MLIKVKYNPCLDENLDIPVYGSLILRNISIEGDRDVQSIGIIPPTSENYYQFVSGYMDNLEVLEVKGATDEEDISVLGGSICFNKETDEFYIGDLSLMYNSSYTDTDKVINERLNKQNKLSEEWSNAYDLYDQYLEDIAEEDELIKDEENFYYYLEIVGLDFNSYSPLEQCSHIALLQRLGLLDLSSRKIVPKSIIFKYYLLLGYTEQEAIQKVQNLDDGEYNVPELSEISPLERIKGKQLLEKYFN